MDLGISSFDIYGDKVIITISEQAMFYNRGRESASELFRKILSRCLADLKRKNSILLNIFDRSSAPDEKNIVLLIKILKFLTKNSADLLPVAVPDSGFFLKR